MRVLVLSEFYPHAKNPHEGIVVREQLGYLARHVEIRVLAPAMRHVPLPRYKILRTQEAPAEEFVDGAFPVSRFPVWNLPLVAEEIAPDMHLRAAQDILADTQYLPELIHAHWSYRSGFIGALLKDEYHCPLVITTHGSDVHTWLDEPKKRDRILFSLHSADAIICVSRALAARLRAEGIAFEKIHHIPNGVDLTAFSRRQTPLMHELQNRFSGVSLFLCVANFLPVKGQDILLQALALLPEDAGAAIFVGDGPEQPRLEKLVKELGLTQRVFFAGKQPHDEIAEWMSAVDVLVIPSRNEGWPTVIFEALACGLQVVGTAVGGIPEALDSDELGIVVPPEDPVALASALSKVAQRKVDREKLRARAEMFSWERLSERVLQVYRSVSGEQRT